MTRVKRVTRSNREETATNPSFGGWGIGRAEIALTQPIGAFSLLGRDLAA
ncbi:hypothetical protein [Mycolicibacter longobardus]|nr:hypothetical protein [Mycolicibacter longobardus]